jgi:hypothetical protein
MRYVTSVNKVTFSHAKYFGARDWCAVDRKKRKTGTTR